MFFTTNKYLTFMCWIGWIAYGFIGSDDKLLLCYRIIMHGDMIVEYKNIDYKLGLCIMKLLLLWLVIVKIIWIYQEYES